MGNSEPSQTALLAAAARAAHPLVDAEPFIFVDDLAGRLLGERAGELLAYHHQHGAHPVLAGARAQAACRARATEHRLAELVAAGVDQYVILGAGLDSFAYRSPLAERVRVFEVDHPATQDWKRAALAANAVSVPSSVAYVPVDFADDSLAEGLRAAGFDRGRRALVSWLGVAMYLSGPAIAATLAVIGSFAPGTELIMDYHLPAGLRDAAGDGYVAMVAPVTAERGEPWRTFLAPDEVSALLTAHGFGAIRHRDQRESVPAALWTRADALSPARLAQLATAVVEAK